VRDDLQITEYTDTQHEPMIPHTILLAPRLKIHRVWNGYYYWRAAPPPRSCTSRCAS